MVEIGSENGLAQKGFFLQIRVIYVACCYSRIGFENGLAQKRFFTDPCYMCGML